MISKEGYEYSLQQQSASFGAVKTYQPLLGIRFAAYRPPNPKSILAAGTTQPLGDTFFFYNINNPPQYQTLLIHNSFSRLHGQWDLLAIISVVLSFLALLISYDAIAGEKRGGTIRLLFSSSARRTTVALGKLLGLITTLAIPVILAAVMAGILLFALIPDYVAQILPEFASLTGLAVLYLSVFVALGIAISAFCHRPFRALVVSLAFWVVLVFALPQITVLVASASNPVPGQEETGARRTELVNQYLEGFRNFPQDAIERRKAWFDLTAWYQGRLYEVWLDTANAIYAQERTAWAWNWISPTSSLLISSTGLCGTGPASEVRAMDSVWQTRARFAEHLEERMLADMRRALGTGEQLPRYENGIPWEAMPKAEFKTAPEASRWFAYAAGAISQIGWLALLAFCSLVLTRRYDPR